MQSSHAQDMYGPSNQPLGPIPIPMRSDQVQLDAQTAPRRRTDEKQQQEQQKEEEEKQQEKQGPILPLSSLCLPVEFEDARSSKGSESVGGGDGDGDGDRPHTTMQRGSSAFHSDGGKEGRMAADSSGTHADEKEKEEGEGEGKRSSQGRTERMTGSKPQTRQACCGPSAASLSSANTADASPCPPPPTSTNTTTDAILDGQRLDALNSCDSNVISYDPSSFFSVVFAIRGRNSTFVAAPLFCLTAWGVVCAAVLSLSLPPRTFDALSSLDYLVGPLLTPVSFLLVFRLTRAAVRYWDARSALGRLVESCRTLSSIASVACLEGGESKTRRAVQKRERKRFDGAAGNETSSSFPSSGQTHDDDDNDGDDDDNDEEEAKELAESFARWLCVFPIAVKNFLRPTNKPGWHPEPLRAKRRVELGSLLNDADAAQVLGEGHYKHSSPLSSSSSSPSSSCPANKTTVLYAHGPLLVLNRLRSLAYRISCHRKRRNRQTRRQGRCVQSAVQDHDTYDHNVRSMIYLRLNEHIDVLTGAWGAMERINATPLPFVYVAHLRTFLILYLALWHLEAVALNGWIALPALFATSWALLGIEAAAVECEQPFRWHSNHLALGRMCVVVSHNVAQALVDAGRG